MRLEQLVELWEYKKFLDKTTKSENKVLKARHRRENNSISLEIYNIKIEEDLIDMIQDSDEEFEMFYKDPK